MTQRRHKFHGTLAIACFGLVASMAACLGDDSSEPPVRDGGTTDHAVNADSPTTPDTSSPRPDGSTPDTSVTPDAGPDSSSTADGGRDSAPEASTADARDSALEAARESGPDSNPPVEAGGDVRVDQVAEAAPPEAGQPEAGQPEASSPEAAPDAEADAAPEAGDTALHLCGFLDDAYGIGDPAPQCVDATPPDCPIQRVANWSQWIAIDFGGSAIFTDCRISGMFATFSDQDIQDYGNAILAWNLAFYGCPSTPATLTYGLIPAPLATHQFTTADLRLISHYYIEGVKQSFIDFGGSPPFSQTQLDLIDAQLAALEQGVPNKTTASTYSFYSCEPDAGSD